MKKNTNSNLTSSEKSFTSKGLEKQESSSPSDSITFTVSKEKLDELKNSKQDTLQHEPVPTGLKILSVLSMISSGFVILVYLALMGGALGSNYLGAFSAIVFVVLLIPFILKFVGALRMYKGKKSGYNIYMIPSVIMILLMIFSIVNGNQNPQIISAIFVTLSMTIFAVIFYNYKEDLK